MEMKYLTPAQLATLTALSQQVLNCTNPIQREETRITREMALDAGDASLEGTIYEQASFERCGGCLECIIAQALPPMLAEVQAGRQVVEAATRLQREQENPVRDLVILGILRQELWDALAAYHAAGQGT